ncbi:MAG: hypothetical protein IE917_03485 [Betaproteobacteria bacterium]|nr:hypothetical protein [Betaproteobacteria bacterium]
MTADYATQREIGRIKVCIAQVWAQREDLKQAMTSGALTLRTGLKLLDETDLLLSDLDSRFKALWDATQPSTETLAHPAAQWAEATHFEPAHLDCVTAIMLKILDGKCKMSGAEKNALTAVYDVVRDRPGHGLDDDVHTLIAQARQGANSVADAIHAWRIRAETGIPKPVMKGFKQWLRASLPIPADHTVPTVRPGLVEGPYVE